MGRCWNCLGEVLSMEVKKLRKFGVLACMYCIIPYSPLSNHVFLEVYQNTFFTKTIRSTIGRGPLESVKLSCGYSLQASGQQKMLSINWALQCQSVCQDSKIVEARWWHLTLQCRYYYLNSQQDQMANKECWLANIYGNIQVSSKGRAELAAKQIMVGLTSPEKNHEPLCRRFMSAVPSGKL